MDQSPSIIHAPERAPTPLSSLSAISTLITDTTDQTSIDAHQEIRNDTEYQANTVLHNQDFLSIIHVLKFRLYGNKDLLEAALQCRWSCQLNKILNSLHTWSKFQPIANLSKAQKIEAISKLAEPTQSLSPASWSWKPYTAAIETNARQIADVIDGESCSLFRRIPFKDWLRHAIGYKEESIDNLLFQQNALNLRLSSYLSQHPEETEKYLKVTKVN